ncbi:hypothetical protein LY90DRAFT_507085 [Neocallimastix californiae]|uniref:Uncharacterized protein n=1 Tax=Neocallimastix californiae TaxID=1754190 RepID=A0A1Y2D8L8_9FUNG|nr:hypothetical protein LY90DRAFT_507085 [Neocallimastix californiae]|eukprot:ORY55609.1 hypothetical protein LY90DRAFT_507085 [Neocallimastix californiae]
MVMIKDNINRNKKKVNFSDIEIVYESGNRTFSINKVNSPDDSFSNDFIDSFNNSLLSSSSETNIQKRLPQEDDLENSLLPPSSSSSSYNILFPSNIISSNNIKLSTSQNYASNINGPSPFNNNNNNNIININNNSNPFKAYFN